MACFIGLLTGHCLADSVRGMIDWNDDTPITLEQACKIAFPEGAVKPTSLKLRARQGKLRVYRPGSRYLTTLRDIRVMLEAVQVMPSDPNIPPAPSPFKEREIAQASLGRALDDLRKMPNRDRAFDPGKLELAAVKANLKSLKNKR